jgi:Zn-dependent protease/CBS domain-containing protein
MNDTVRLGRILGVPVGINWTWVLVFAVFAWSLGSAVFPATNPGLSTATYVGMALVAELLFFGSLLLHELGHAVVARREGMTIDGITLWLFGGVARFRGMFPSAGAEFRIAIAGPVVTAALAGLFVAFAALTRLGPAVDGVAAWLGYINLLLLGFNLLPALPLDGGRVLRAGLWKAKADFAWATRVAAAIGRAFGVTMIGGGLVLFFLHGAFADLWLAIMGWFLLGAAKAEAGLASDRGGLDGLVVGDVMTPRPVTARADQTLREFMDQVAWSHERAAYPVLDGERPVGLLVLRHVASIPQRDWASVRVRDEMLSLREVPVVSEGDPAAGVLISLVRRRADAALVVDGARLVGMLSTSELQRSAGARLQAARLRRPRPLSDLARHRSAA